MVKRSKRRPRKNSDSQLKAVKSEERKIVHEAHKIRLEEEQILREAKRLRDQEHRILGEERKLHAEEQKIHSGERKIHAEEGMIGKEVRWIKGAEKNIENLQTKLFDEEKYLMWTFKHVKVKKEHVLDFFKIVGGSLVGTSFGQGFADITGIAQTVSWGSIFAIIAMSLTIGAVLIYEAEKKDMSKRRHPYTYLFLRVSYVWLIAVGIGGLTALFFMPDGLETTMIIKSILVGSYPALVGGIGFNFI